MNKKVNMKELFLDMQQEMLTRLNSIRKHVTHAPTKGDAVERNWIEFLSAYLPNRYCVDSAFVVDHTGTRSDQIDLIIYDQQYSPFVFLHDGVKFIPAESVYAIFEIKQALNKPHIEYAAAKAESVRALKRTSVPIVHAGGTYPPRPVFEIVAGLITTSSDWSPPFGKSFHEAMGTLKPWQHLNIGCALDSGSFLLKQDGSLDTSTPEEALIFFFIKLFTQLQNLGTVPAMDIDLYSRALDSI
ncbi:hypothetical protein SAMN02799624_05864 [Paenibacillus sp. UNC496MF]|uniref:DUF6602 domain-containing protein n=1 Tax=Paenibacillus sp. UNC496MF TaxID=1502753 RepID=UPI0008E91D5C|nr:DUF6602 domain-containing protein [Paenibacillus sp. UNC496MF]SFJ76628.1 hypothetical protein SAMN02799624_05864 [Paenibacillus sp. UNC496MF]